MLQPLATLPLVDATKIASLHRRAAASAQRFGRQEVFFEIGKAPTPRDGGTGALAATGKFRG